MYINTSKKMELDFSQWSPVAGQEGENTLKCRRVYLKTGRTYFTLRMTEHWLKFPREVVKSPLLASGLSRGLDQISRSPEVPSNLNPSVVL